MQMIYKPEIDGLRAVAVLLVLFCHLDLAFQGGFIGVDVFFVISGFLITSIIVNGIEHNNFSFIQFYARRFIRLYPALIVVIALTFAVGFLIASPEMLANLAESGKYALVSASNIYFSEHQGYFDIGAQQQVFLHTWTLGVEWQFYLLSPFFIWLLLKHSRKALIFGLVVLVVVSVVLCEQKLGTNPSKAYYSMRYRAFELGIGSLLVFVYQKRLSVLISIMLTVLGIGMIFASGVIYSPTISFPGYAALLPTLGAAFCIYGGQGFEKGNVLKFPPIVYIGKISYSVYLVHWPLWVFCNYYLYRETTLSEKFTLAVLSLALGASLYHLVEKRLNWRFLTRYKCGVLTGVLGMMTLTSFFSYGLHYVANTGKGLPWRISSSYAHNEEYAKWAGDGYQKNARLGAPEGKPIAILTGDSYALSYALGFDELLQQSGKSILMNAELGCLVSEHYQRIDIQDVGRCGSVYSEVFDENSDDPIIISQAWSTYYHRKFSDGTSTYSFQSLQEYIPFLEKNLEDLRHASNGRKLILISSPLFFDGGKDKRMVMRPTYLGDFELRESLVSEMQAYPTSQFLEHYASQHNNVYFIDLAPILCPDDICTEERNVMLYHDDSHFSHYGSRLVGQYALDEVEKILLGIPETIE